MNYWNDFWSTKQNGEHRWQHENFLKREAEEKIYHLGKGESLLDFGCGSADLLVYYAAVFKDIIGVDFSESMLANAHKRVEEFQLNNIHLCHANHQSVWTLLDPQQRFDRICAGQVVQYLSIQEIDNFVEQALKVLNPWGKIIFFDVIDPNIYFLYKVGAFGYKKDGQFIGDEYKLSRYINNFLKLLVSRTWRRCKGLPKDQIGNSFRPSEFRAITDKYNIKMEYVWSMYYEYRYHVIISF
jgi:cyclopropane-fatty-acyl-phospholipid synthase